VPPGITYNARSHIQEGGVGAEALVVLLVLVSWDTRVQMHDLGCAARPAVFYIAAAPKFRNLWTHEAYKDTPSPHNPYTPYTPLYPPPTPLPHYTRYTTIPYEWALLGIIFRARYAP